MVKDCWIIGDKFINEIYYALPEANQDRISETNHKLHIYDNYNVRCFSSHRLTKIKEAPARLVNSLINALNEDKSIRSTHSMVERNLTAAFLPRFIIVVPDWDIVKHVGHYKFGVMVITE